MQQPENEGLACVKVSVPSRGAASQFFRSLRDFKTSAGLQVGALEETIACLGLSFQTREFQQISTNLGYSETFAFGR